MEQRKHSFKASELNLPEVRYTMSMNIYPPKSHYKFTMQLGRVFPNSTAQAKFFISKGICLDVLNAKDVCLLENFLNRYNFEGKYRYTKSKQFVRLVNWLDLEQALKIAYNL
jgi:hypothetical protein